MDSQDPFAQSKRRERVRTIVLSSIGVLAIAIVVYFFTRSQASTILVQVPTKGTSIQINGEPAHTVDTGNGLAITALAGSYRLIITRNGALPYTQDLVVPARTTVTVRPVFTLVSSGVTASGGISLVRPVPDLNRVFYLSDNGRTIFQLDTTQQVQYAVTEHSLLPVTDISWSPGADLALVTRPDGVYLFEPQKYDFVSQRFDKIVDSEVTTAIFDPQSTRVAAVLQTQKGEHSLVLTDKRFTDLARKADLNGFTNPKLVWSPNSRLLAVINRANDPSQNDAFVYNLTDGSFTPITRGGNVVNVLFSPDEQTVLIERTGSSLQIHPLATGVEVPLPQPGKVEQASWKNQSQFYLPAEDGKSFLLYDLGGHSQPLSFANGTSAPIVGSFYFSGSDSLVFYTVDAVYTVNTAR